jgi:hypothetical protein
MSKIADSTMTAPAVSASDQTAATRPLYVACPILLALILGLSLTMPHGILVYAFYAIVVVGALPTWDRQFVRQISLAAAVFVLLDAALLQEPMPGPWKMVLNSATGLLSIWAALHLSLETIAAYESRLQEAIRQAQAAARGGESPGHIVMLCAWTKRVKEDGKWVPLEEFLERHFLVRISHGMSDEVHDHMVRETNPHLHEDHGAPTEDRQQAEN